MLEDIVVRTTMRGEMLRRLGASFGLIGAIAFAILWTLAVIEDGTWVFGEDTLSELGRIGGGGSDLFNAGVILSSLLWLPFAYSLLQATPRTLPGRIGSAMFMLSALALLAIGLFPIDSGTPHTVASWTFFALSLLSLLILVIPMLQSDVFGRIGAVTSLIASLLPLVLLLTTSVPLAEAIAVIGLMAWASIISLIMLFNWSIVGAG
jgi:hypothetical membrane protein